ncbi:hypothetical protein BU17DRAFT_42883 [Hysterangium stoloniferum]|nr:hypothetical protein BU17DRAFT_42883 [Hysterangium stoloniferum]
MASTVLLLSLLSTLSLATAYSFDLTAAPTQCGPLSIAITQGQGTPPYSALVVPFGASPTQTEVRTVIQHNFTDTQTSFNLPFPANAGFVIMVSDSRGIGTGGTSAPTNVAASATNNSSCLPKSVATSFSFQIIPNSAINQCQQTTLAWDNSTQGVPTILLVIPGGQSSLVPVGTTSPADGGTTGFPWTPNVRAGTNIILVAGDNRGPGTGGSVNIAVGNGADSCINATSPSSTAGTPAGAVETGSGSGNNNNNTSRGSSGNVAAIAAGIVGGLAAIVVVGLAGFFFIRRRKRMHHDTVDLLPDAGGSGSATGHADAPPEFYQPEPYILSSISGTHSRNVSAEDGTSGPRTRPSMSDLGRRYSALSMTDQDLERDLSESTRTGTGPFLGGARSGTPHSQTQTSRKGAPSSMLRPVNWVQHEDAGVIPQDEAGGSAQQPETIEVPPSYDDIRR